MVVLLVERPGVPPIVGAPPALHVSPDVKPPRVELAAKRAVRTVRASEASPGLLADGEVHVLDGLHLS